MIFRLGHGPILTTDFHETSFQILVLVLRIIMMLETDSALLKTAAEIQ